MKTLQKLSAVCAAIVITGCYQQDPGVGSNNVPYGGDQAGFNYCDVNGGQVQCVDYSQKVIFSGSTFVCDCDGDKLLDLGSCDRSFRDDESQKNNCRASMRSGCTGYVGTTDDLDYCHFNYTVGGNASSGSVSGGTSSGSVMSTSSSNGGNSSSRDECAGDIRPVNCGTSVSSSGGGQTSSSAAMTSSSSGGSSTSLDPCDPSNLIRPVSCNTSSSSSGSQAQSSSTAAQSSSSAAQSSSAQASSSSAQASSSTGGASSSSGNPAEVWQYRDLCAQAPFGTWPVARASSQNGCLDLNLCTMIRSFDTGICPANGSVGWVGTDDDQPWDWSFGNARGLLVVEQSAGAVWGQYCPMQSTVDRDVQGTLRCNGPDNGSFASLREPYNLGITREWMVVNADQSVNIKFHQEGTSQGASSSSSSMSVSSSSASSSSMNASSSASSTGGVTSSSSSSSGASSSSTSSSSSTGGAGTADIAWTDPQQSVYPGAVQFNPGTFTGNAAQLSRLQTARAVCASGGCSYVNSTPLTLVFGNNNQVTGMRFVPTYDGWYELQLLEDDGARADFDPICDSITNSSFCYINSNVSDRWTARFQVTTVNGVKTVTPQGGNNPGPGQGGGLVTVKSYNTSESSSECRPGQMTQQQLNACLNSVDVFFQGLNIGDIREWIGLYTSTATLIGYKVVYADPCDPDTTYCQQQPKYVAAGQSVTLFATEGKPFNVVAVIQEGNAVHQLNLGFVGIHEDNPDANPTGTCSFGFHREANACLPNNRLKFVAANGQANLMVGPMQ